MTGRCARPKLTPQCQALRCWPSKRDTRAARRRAPGARRKHAFSRCFSRCVRFFRDPARMARTRCRARGADAIARAVAAARKIFCDRLLTAEKTVIRFRPNGRSLQKRVIKHNAMAGSTTRTSARNIKRWTPASHPSRKEEAPPIETCSAGRRGFFVGCGTSTAALRGIASRQPIRPVRLARRRSLAGPIPVVSFETGLCRNTH